MCEERGLVVGDVVRVKKQVLQCYTAIAYKKFAERTGTVEKLFIPLGGLKQRARVLWHKWGNRGKEFHDVFYVRDLEAVPANAIGQRGAACGASDAPTGCATRGDE